MRKSLFCLSFVLLSGLYSTGLWSQCTPGDAITCPDPENNGQVCPDSLLGAIAGKLYSQAFTILAPPGYPINESDTLPLHHVTLIDVSNLPGGITWLSNSLTNEFMVGTYYCVLLEGTPTVAGKYSLKITVDVYIPPIPPNPNPILVARVTDSTSLFIDVKWDPNRIEGYSEKSMTLLGPQPNPFSGDTRMGIQLKEPGMVRLDIYDLVGQLRYTEPLQADRGTHYFDFDGRQLTRGIYILKVSNGISSQTVRLIKTE